MDEQTVSSTSPFYTLDAFDGALAIEVMLAVEAAVQGDEAPWAQLVEEHEGLRNRLLGQGIATPEVWSSIEWDSAMLLFTTCVELAPDGRPLPVGETMTKERFGRFPYGNGSALDYLLEYIRPNRSITEHDGQSIYDALIDLLNKLHSGCREAHRGDRHAEGQVWRGGRALPEATGADPAHSGAALSGAQRSGWPAPVHGHFRQGQGQQHALHQPQV